MKTSSKLRRVGACALFGTIALGAVAASADAHPRYRRDRVVETREVRVARGWAPVYQRPAYARYTVWRSDRGPLYAGFLGGLFLGATLRNTAPQGFVYWDPYCHRGFASLELYDAHCRSRSHEREIEVVEAPRGYDRGDCNDQGGDQYGDEDDQDN